MLSAGGLGRHGGCGAPAAPTDFAAEANVRPTIDIWRIFRRNYDVAG